MRRTWPALIAFLNFSYQGMILDNLLLFLLNYLLPSLLFLWQLAQKHCTGLLRKYYYTVSLLRLLLRCARRQKLEFLNYHSLQGQMRRIQTMTVHVPKAIIERRKKIIKYRLIVDRHSGSRG
jgi:hypothetical protein